MESGEQKARETLNPFQANRLRITCQYIDKLLSEIEEILNTTGSKAAFPRYIADILPAQRRTIEDYIARVRAQLIRILKGQDIARGKPFIPASRAVHVNLGAIDIAAEELRPKYMRGYGEVPESVATELNGIVGELAGLIQRFDRCVSGGLGEDLKTRLERLESSGNDLTFLKRIEQTVRDRGLVEFRPAIAAILDRAEDKSFEIAVFGRVSSGKSSLLNTILETDVLPVGVTPITAVPTRIIYADQPALTVWFSETPRKRVDISELREFATEQENPGNVKHVASLVLALPARRLQGGVSFVDTPGLGSLATSGARETLAYLPKCDLGVVLIDAGSTLTADDLQTILTLQEAAIPINVLLSKADLVGAEDRARMTTYIRDHIQSECKLQVPAHPVSVLPSCREMLNRWFEEQIVPLYARSQELRAASLRRKIGALRDSVVTSLELRLRRSSQSSAKSREQAQEAEALLRTMTGRIEDTRAICSRFTRSAAEDAARKNSPDLAEEAARRLLHAWKNSSYGVVVPSQLIRDSITQSIQVEARKLQGEVTALAQQLGIELRRCAASLELSDVPAEREFEALVRGTPLFECPSFAMTVSRPRSAQILGERVATSWVSGRISRQLPATFFQALETYWNLLGDWSNSVFGDLRRKFETYAESYRAHAEQALGERELTKEEVAALQQSLMQLRPERTGSSDAGASSPWEIPTTQEKSA
jgi:GTP-binding protein EngB required for normal cell division